LREYSIRKFLQLTAIDDAGTRDILDAVASQASASKVNTVGQKVEIHIDTVNLSADTSKVKPW